MSQALLFTLRLAQAGDEPWLKVILILSLILLSTTAYRLSSSVQSYIRAGLFHQLVKTVGLPSLDVSSPAHILLEHPQ